MTILLQLKYNRAMNNSNETAKQDSFEEAINSLILHNYTFSGLVYQSSFSFLMSENGIVWNDEIRANLKWFKYVSTKQNFHKQFKKLTI